MKDIKSTFEKGINGIPDTIEGIDVVYDSITQILNTRKGERIGAKNYGCDLLEIIFENNTKFLKSRVHEEVLTALKKWEKRIQIESNDIIVDTSENEVRITINFQYLGENYATNEVFTKSN